MDHQFESTKLSTPLEYVRATAFRVATFGTIALTSGFFLKPGATFDDYIADVLPLLSLRKTIALGFHRGFWEWELEKIMLGFIRPQFFYNNSLLPFIKLVVGPYTDDLGNVLPNGIEGVRVPADPLAFAGLLAMLIVFKFMLAL